MWGIFRFLPFFASRVLPSIVIAFPLLLAGGYGIMDPAFPKSVALVVLVLGAGLLCLGFYMGVGRLHGWVTLDYQPFTTYHRWLWSNSSQAHVKAKTQQACSQYQNH
jgi:hypothetical protein